MVSANHIRAAVERMRGCMRSAGDTTDGAIREISRIIALNADDDAHVKRAADRIIDTMKWFPSPAEVREALVATADQPAAEELGFVARGCEQCDWTGWIPVSRGGLEAVSPCQCQIEGRMQERPAPGPSSPAAVSEQRRILQELAREMEAAQ